MTPDERQAMLETIPGLTELLKAPAVTGWLKRHPAALVTDCLRLAVAQVRREVLGDPTGSVAGREITTEGILNRAGALLEEAAAPRVCRAINATGIILHTGLGRAVFPESVIDSLTGELKGCVNLAVDRATGERIERDRLVEPILTELTGAEAATVVNNNAAATLLVLAALAAQREVIVSRGQLIEIGGSFRLPEVMAQSQARLVEVGATNRTHLKDYRQAITPNTAALMRVHPSNYRVVGFTKEIGVGELAGLAHEHGLIMIDDLGAGALLDLEPFGLPHEPTVRESIRVGADLVLFSGDKLIGASQAGVVVGRKVLIDRLRGHPLMRAVRIDKTCLMIVERTLHLFRDPERLRREHPTYRMICASPETLRSRGRALIEAIGQAARRVSARLVESDAYLGSGSLPTQALPSFTVAVAIPGLSAEALARRLRLDPACVFSRIEDDLVQLDLRTMTDADLPEVASALGRIGAT